jgi:hypothetical protein
MALAIAVMTLTMASQADFVGLSAELVAVNAVQAVPGQPDYPDTWTCRIYADFDDADHLTSIYGDADNYMLFATDSQFYQNAFGAPTTAGIDVGQLDLFPDLHYDSWLTIGLSDSTDNELLEVGMSWSAFETGSPLFANNGAVFVLPDAAQGYAQNDGSGTHRVLISQLTVFGTGNTKIWGQLNLLWSDAQTGVASAEFIEFSFANIPSPAVLTLLAMAGLTGARRRR